MKTPITYYGGKQTLVKHLLALIPPHKMYCEPFFGGGALFFAKPKSDTEVINDINGEVINFFKVTQTKFSELEKEIRATLHSRQLFRDATVVYENPKMFSEVKRAWAFWTLANQGFSGMLTSWGFGNDDSKEASLARKRENFTKDYSERLKSVQMEANDALKVIDRCDAKDTFFYIDPPYFNSHQGHYKGYTKENYLQLLEKLKSIKGKFLLSSYPSPELKNYIRKYKWNVRSISKFVAVTKRTDKKKTELFVFNYKPKIAGNPETTRVVKAISIKKLTTSLKKLKFSDR